MPRNDGRPTISPSTVLTFMAEPAIYLLRKRFGIKGEVGPGAWMGDAVHHGTAYQLLNTADTDRALALAHDKFLERSQGEVREDIEEAKARIPACLKQSYDALSPFGKPITIEGWVEAPIPGTDWLVRGRTDFGYSDFCVDLKTGRNCYTKPLADHVIQMGCYWRATGLPQKVCYVTEKKFGIVNIPEEDLQTAWNQVVAVVRAISRIEEHSDHDAIALCPPRDLTGFRWDDQLRTKARELWNL